MSSRTKNLNMYVDCRRAFELAARDGKAQQLCVSKNSAIHFRQRMYQFRQLEAKRLEVEYRQPDRVANDFEKIGTTPFDRLVCRIEKVDITVSDRYGVTRRFEWAVNIERLEEVPLLNYKGEIEPEYQEPVRDEEDLLG